jgi:hypothetical protein
MEPTVAGVSAKTITEEEACDVMYANSGEVVETATFGNVTKVAVVEHGPRRWLERMTHVFRDSDGAYWSFDYDAALTDLQEGSFCEKAGDGGVLVFRMDKTVKMVEATTYSRSIDDGGTNV